jgi:hypothetical protein
MQSATTVLSQIQAGLLPPARREGRASRRNPAFP